MRLILAAFILAVLSGCASQVTDQLIPAAFDAAQCMYLHKC